MSLTLDEQTYRDKRQLKRLTFDGVNDLYQTLHGAHTIKRAIELDEVQRLYLIQKNAAKASPVITHITVSDQLEMRNERCIDHCGCGTFSS